MFPKRVVSQLGKYQGNVLIKPYPMHRYIDPEKIWEQKFQKNITIAPFCEFRNLRYVADILLLDISSSTISWAVTTDIPIIYINNSTNALTLNAEKAFKEAFFYVDSNECNWEAKLASILLLTHNELKANWAKMEVSRNRVIDNFIMSRNGSFKDGILNALEQASTCILSESA